MTHTTVTVAVQEQNTILLLFKITNFQNERKRYHVLLRPKIDQPINRGEKGTNSNNKSASDVIIYANKTGKYLFTL